MQAAGPEPTSLPAVRATYPLSVSRGFPRLVVCSARRPPAPGRMQRAAVRRSDSKQDGGSDFQTLGKGAWPAPA